MHLLGILSLSFALLPAFATNKSFKAAPPNAPIDCELTLVGPLREVARIFLTGEAGLLDQFEDNNVFGSRMAIATDEAVRVFGLGPGMPGGVSFEVDRDPASNDYFFRLLQARSPLLKVNLERDPALVWRAFTKETLMETAVANQGRIPVEIQKVAGKNYGGYSLGTSIPEKDASYRRFLYFQRSGVDEVQVVVGIDVGCPSVNTYMKEEFPPLFLLQNDLVYCRVGVYSATFKLRPDPYRDTAVKPTAKP